MANGCEPVNEHFAKTSSKLNQKLRGTALVNCTSISVLSPSPGHVIIRWDELQHCHVIVRYKELALPTRVWPWLKKGWGQWVFLTVGGLEFPLSSALILLVGWQEVHPSNGVENGCRVDSACIFVVRMRWHSRWSSTLIVCRPELWLMRCDWVSCHSSVNHMPPAQQVLTTACWPGTSVQSVSPGATVLCVCACVA